MGFHPVDPVGALSISRAKSRYGPVLVGLEALVVGSDVPHLELALVPQYGPEILRPRFVRLALFTPQHGIFGMLVARVHLQVQVPLKRNGDVVEGKERRLVDAARRVLVYGDRSPGTLRTWPRAQSRQILMG
jgi:hypothetical protein